MRSEKIINFRQFRNKKITFFFISTQTSAAQIPTACVWQMWCEHILLLLWSDETRFITFIWFCRRFVHFSPEIVTEQIPIFRRLDLLGPRFGSVGSPVTQGDHSTMRRPEFCTLQIQIQTRLQVQIFIWLGKHCQPWRPFNNVAGQTSQPNREYLQGALQL